MLTAEGGLASLFSSALPLLTPEHFKLFNFISCHLNPWDPAVKRFHCNNSVIWGRPCDLGPLCYFTICLVQKLGNLGIIYQSSCFTERKSSLEINLSVLTVLNVLSTVWRFTGEDHRLPPAKSSYKEMKKAGEVVYNFKRNLDVNKKCYATPPPKKKNHGTLKKIAYIFNRLWSEQMID